MATTAQLSKSGQMRLKKAAGMSVSDIARLFGVTYHHAYAVVVTRAAAESRISSSATAHFVRKTPAGRTLTPSILATMPEDELSKLSHEDLLWVIAEVNLAGNKVSKRLRVARVRAEREVDTRFGGVGLV